MAIKRLRYFDHQFLVDADFKDEQKYHMDMRRRLNRTLNTFGIGEGLEVVKKTDKIVTVRAGVAIDNLGREIILEAEQDVNLNAISTAVPAFITIAYGEQPTDGSGAESAPGDTRFMEAPILQAVTASPPTDGSVVRLARINLTAGGNVPGNPNEAFDDGVRQQIRPKASGPVSIGGVSNPGGNIDLQSTGAITISPDIANRRITIVDNHSAQVGNVHGLTAANLQAIGALLANQYDLRQRSLANFTLSQTSGGPVIAPGPRPVSVAFQPRFVLALGNISVVFNSRNYGGATTAFFDTGTDIQQGFGVRVTLNAISGGITDWNISSSLVSGICQGQFVDVPPAAGARTSETLSLVIVGTSSNSLTLQFNRTVPTGAAALNNFNIVLSMLIMG
jgi:hypothetical protein